MEARFLTTSTGPFPLETFGSLQQFLEDLGAHLVRGRTNSHFDRFEIKPATLAQSSEDHSQQRTSFARDFFLNRFEPFFFSPADCSVRFGRKRQICSFTSSNSWLSRRKRWYSSTSRWALRKAASLEKVSVTVLPSTLRVNR